MSRPLPENNLPPTSENIVVEEPPPSVGYTAAPTATAAARPIRVPAWEPISIFFVTLAVLALFTPRVVNYLSPTTGDEPFYLMTAISILRDGDLNECNNYANLDDALLYPSFYSFDGAQAYAAFPNDWKGWRGAPYPLPPHPAQIVPASRQCASVYRAYPVDYDRPGGELYSKHGLGLTMLVLPAFALGGRLAVVYFLNVLAALLAANVYLIARESTRKLTPALLTWAAFAFTVPQLPYSYLIFPELPAALFVLYAFRRIRLMGNNLLQTTAIGICIGFLPWLHYRFAPISIALALYYIYQSRKLKQGNTWQSYLALMVPPVASAVVLLGFFYQRYAMPFPNPADHAGISDVAGTERGAMGLFLDQQWGLFVAAPIFILTLVGLILMAQMRRWRTDLLWLCVVSVPYFLIVANYAQWWGEWCPPARYIASILPLLALPFALVLDNINTIVIKVIYGVLLLLSLLTSWGFLVQPQWLYNQPDGKALILKNGLPQLASALNLPIRVDLTQIFPSFVTPYFAYLRDRSLGDAASATAWRTSVWLLAFIVGLVLLCLALAWRSSRGENSTNTGAGADGTDTGDPQAGKPDAPTQVLPTVSFRRLRARMASRLLLLRHTAQSAFAPVLMPRVLQPAFVGSGFSRPLRFQTEAPDPTGERTRAGADGTNGTNGNSSGDTPVTARPAQRVLVGDGAGTAVAERTQQETAPAPEPDVAKKPQGFRARLMSNFLWRTRGLWLGLIALGMAMYAQKLTTVDRDIILSIRWYALAIIVMIVGWFGTYKNRSFLVVPTEKPIVEVPAETAPATSVDVPVSPAPAASTLPVRKRAAPPPTPATTPAHAAAPTTTLPVRSRSANGAGRSNGAGAPAVATAPAAALAGAGSAVRPPSAWQRFNSRFPSARRVWWRYALAFVALGLNLYSASQLRSDYSSAVGSWGWLASLALLIVAFIREPRKEVRDPDPHDDIMERTDVRISRRVEIGIVLVIFLLGLGLRLLNLGDWTTGMHGDEGEAGMDALNILEGNRVSPFLTGWFFQPNFYYWGIALTMKVFGTDLFGLRMFSTMAGAIMIVPFYLLVKMWFGVRTAIIASLLLAISDVAIHFSKAEFSNITTPLCLTLGFLFLFRGLRSKRNLEFVLSAYSFMLSLYFYMGARLTPFLVIALFVYLYLMMPVVRLPGAYLDLRRLKPNVGKLRLFREAAWGQFRSLAHYFPQWLIFAIAAISFAAPWSVYYIDNQFSLNERTNEKLIFRNEGRMAGQYNLVHDPLYLGIRMPTDSDIYPFLPVFFEQTPVSVKVTDDGFWPRALWNQLTTTLSIFTYRPDASSVYTFTGDPVSKPIEAALLILGLAWALWRWRDTRMATISIWFWASVIVGGVFTIDAPYMARIVGILPVMALAIALPVSKLMSEFLRFAGLLAARMKRVRTQRVYFAGARVFSASVLGVLLLYLAFQNYGDYFLRYTKSYAFTDVTGQAYFVRQMNNTVTSEGRPVPRYYNLGIHTIYWGHGDNRFLNHGTPGSDMVNPANDLPVIENDNRDVVYMIWPHTQQYLSVLQSYYPEGEKGDFVYGPPGGSVLLNYFRVKKEQIDARRHTLATYTPAGGPAVQRNEESFGNTGALPDGLQYPVTGQWTGNLLTPAYGRYTFSLDNQGDGSLIIDGTQVLTTTAETPHAEGTLLLARGPHDVELLGSLASPESAVNLQWSVTGQDFAPIPKKYLWDGPGRALVGKISSYVGDLLNPAAQGSISNRVDGFLGFRHSPEALIGGPLTGIWTGTLDIKQPGSYSFDVSSNGDSILLIDNTLVVNNIRGGTDPHTGSGQIDLEPGPHTFELRYNWSGGTGYLEAYWTTPDGIRKMIDSSALHTDGGVIDPTQVVSEPPPVQIEPEQPATRANPAAMISGGLINPRGVAVDKAGNIYVGDRGNHRVVVFAQDGKVLHTWGTAAPQPAEGQAPGPVKPGEFADILDVAVGDDGTVYVFDNTPRVQAFTAAGEYLGSIEPEQLGLYAPNGIGAAAPGGDAAKHSMYIAVTGQNRILGLPSVEAVTSGQVTLPGGTEAISAIEGDVLEQPVDVVADPSGTGFLYAIDLKDRIVQLTPQQNPDGTRKWTISRQWRVLVGRDEGGSRLGISPDGQRIYMSDPDRKRVAVLDLGRGQVSYFGGEGQDPGLYSGPSGIAVGDDGKVYVVDRINNSVQVYSQESLKK